MPSQPSTPTPEPIPPEASATICASPAQVPPLATPPVSTRPTPWRLVTRTGVQSGWRLGGEGGEPWLALHGGPGGGASPGLLAPFDGARQVVWGPHQRGCWSAGRGRVQDVTVAALVADLEALRVALGLERWAVLGGSWGAYLALAYLARHPESVSRVVLRGSFVASRAEIWGLLRALPAAWLRSRGLPVPLQYTQVLPWLARGQSMLRFGATRPAAQQLTQAWLLAEWMCAARGAARTLRRAEPEASHAPLQATVRQLRHGQRVAQVALTARPKPNALRKVAVQVQMLHRLLAHRHDHPLRHAGPRWRDWLAQGGSVQLVHGRCDAICPPRNARRLQQTLTGATLDWVRSGHLASEPAMAQALRRAVRGAA